MKRITHAMMMLVAASSLSLAGCDKKEEPAADKKAEPKADKPSLMLSNDTDACRSALKCCEAMVEADKGKATPEDINLSCSGVGMAETDDMCNDFKKGYAMSFEADGKPAPDACK